MTNNFNSPAFFCDYDVRQLAIRTSQLKVILSKNNLCFNFTGPKHRAFDFHSNKTSNTTSNLNLWKLSNLLLGTNDNCVNDKPLSYHCYWRHRLPPLNWNRSRSFICLIHSYWPEKKTLSEKKQKKTYTNNNEFCNWINPSLFCRNSR